MNGRKYLEEFIKNFELIEDKEQYLCAFDVIAKTFKDGNSLFVGGNGGSASDAEHIVGELVKKFSIDRKFSDKKAEELTSFGERGELLAKYLVPSFPAYSLNSQTSILTAMGNDVGFEYAYAQQVEAYGKKGDVLLCISTSGNSLNLVNAAIVAKTNGVKVISLTGRDGGELRQYSDLVINVPLKETYQIQEQHIRLYHALCSALEREFFGNE